MNIGPMQLAIIALLILVLFGAGRISGMMGDFGKGIRSFKKGLNEPDEDEVKPAPAPPAIQQQAPAPAEKPAEAVAAETGSKNNAA